MARRVSSQNQASTAAGPGSLLAALLAAEAFGELDVGASFFERGTWQAIQQPEASIVEFEAQGPTEHLRWRYNERCCNDVMASGRSVLGHHAGLCDLFVPIPSARVGPLIVVGPFAVGRPTQAEICDRWQTLTNTHARMSDASFSSYLDTTLRVLTLEPRSLATFQRFVERFAALLGGAGDPARLSAEIASLRRDLMPLRAVERMWHAARSMMDDRTTQRWWTPSHRDPLLRLGMKQRPEHAIAGLVHALHGVPDAVEDTLRRDALQRALTELGYARGNLICGPIGRHGVALFVGAPGSRARAKLTLQAIVARASDVARGFGFRLHAGIALAESGQTLAVRYRAALAAAEKALSERASLRLATEAPEPSTKNLTLLRSQLAAGAASDSATWVIRFERYAEAVVAHAGYRLDATRAHLQAGFERLAEPVLASGQLDQKSFDELCAGVDAAPENAVTVSELVSAFREVVADLARAAAAPTVSRHDRNTQRGLRFMREHLGEPLTLAQVAHVSGFAPNYFSRLLRRAEGLSFERLLLRLRLESSKRTLAGTSLGVERVAALSGFKSRTHFQQAFKRAYGETPMEYRERSSTELISGRRPRTVRPEWVLRFKRRATDPERP